MILPGLAIILCAVTLINTHPSASIYLQRTLLKALLRINPSFVLLYIYRCK